MTEKEMEDLLWNYPDRFFREKLTPFRRQPSSTIGRADLVFTDDRGDLLVVEIKIGRLGRKEMIEVMGQLRDYYGLMKNESPKKAVDLMLVAHDIPRERKLALAKEDIESKEIPESRFRKVAEEIGYEFESEKRKKDNTINVKAAEPPVRQSRDNKAWYYWRDSRGRAYILAFVNAKNACSKRCWDTHDYSFIDKEYKSGDFQDIFKDFIEFDWRLCLSKQPNLERDCKERLPDWVIEEIKPQIDDILRE